MGDTPRKALSACVGSSSSTHREWCGFVRVHRVSIAPHHANVAHSPTRLPRQSMPPNSSTRARWNRLEQPELTSQTAVRTCRTRGPCEAFVRARAMRVCGYRGRLYYKYTEDTGTGTGSISLGLVTISDFRISPSFGVSYINRNISTRRTSLDLNSHRTCEPD